ncbi:hypothetical protein STRDD11_01041 [Streptococcus sp. DD11]|uniref:DUF2785 domain-containing protein n=1 Tax=Streptococcus sp. DD11 TaxID=1777879 RepID=UPI00079AD466|nr:DUF2785 domain-containing protein [Streptococcus sp. DD11]KXT84275.1 hypothetical protein STRDD11_01041 [Streptococcus sp. DD11]
MYQNLQKKLEEETPFYCEEEILWLLDRIGHQEASVRDGLVFSSLARGLQNELFSDKQFRFLAQEAVKRQGLFYKSDENGQAALTRSFTALLYANLLNCDGNPNSSYYQALSVQERKILLDNGLAYLLTEKDTSGYSEEYGWVHAFAHGADLLTEAACHPDFPSGKMSEVLQVIQQVFKIVSVRFGNDEDWRLAQVLYQAVLKGKLSQHELSLWLQSLNFPLDSKQDFIAFSNFRSCLLEVCVQLDSKKQLSEELRTAIQNFHY